ncbi:MAG: hypothetical protein IPM58_18550 [Nitrospira sp.]|nr:hypothetical protein [Nitrospira sp.]
MIDKILTHLGLPTRAPDRRVDLFQTIWQSKTACQTQADAAARERAARIQNLSRAYRPLSG